VDLTAGRDSFRPVRGSTAGTATGRWSERVDCSARGGGVDGIDQFTRLFDAEHQTLVVLVGQLDDDDIVESVNVPELAVPVGVERSGQLVTDMQARSAPSPWVRSSSRDRA